MKLTPISEVNNINQAKNNYSNNKTSKTFKGYVNGKYFRDEVISEAKKALKNPNWREKFLAQKKSLGDTLSTWHKREGSNDIAGRVIMGIMTLGITEVTWGLANRAMDASENKGIDNFIREVEDCMDNLRRSGSV